VNDMIGKFQTSDFERGGLVEFALGAAPHTGAFVMVHNENPVRRKLMSYLKMGAGPLHMFYTPYHLPPMQLPHSVARAVLFNDATITPKGAPTCDTIAFAKRDLKVGERLDGMGGFTCYGLVDRYDVCRDGDDLRRVDDDGLGKSCSPEPLRDGRTIEAGERSAMRERKVSFAEAVISTCAAAAGPAGPDQRDNDRIARRQSLHIRADSVDMAGSLMPVDCRKGSAPCSRHVTQIAVADGAGGEVEGHTCLADGRLGVAGGAITAEHG